MTWIPEASRRRLVVIFVMTAVMLMQAIVGASPAQALTRTPDDTYMTNGKVYASALSEDGNTLYIGGSFSRVRENPPGAPGVSRVVSNVAAIDVATGAALRTWRPPVTGGAEVVRSLAVEDGKVYIGGNFTAVGGEPRRNLAAVDASTGAVSSFAPAVGGPTSYVYALQASGSRLYAGGGFLSVDGQPLGNLAAFDLASGALDPAWRPKTNGKVRSLELDPARTSLFVGGSFTSITGSDGHQEARQSVGRVDASTGNLHPWKIPSGVIGNPQTAWDLTATPTRLYGGFGGTETNYLAAFRLDLDNTGQQVWRFKATGNVQTVALSENGTRLFFGGHFGIKYRPQPVCGNKSLRGLASVDPATGRVFCDWLPSIEGPVPNFNGPWALTTTGAHLWVGGGFTGVSGRDQSNLARFTL